MPIYVYETTDPNKPVRQFEVKQSMADQPLKSDPATGEPVRRVISGGYGILQKGGAPASMPRSGGCAHGSCGCH